MLPKNQHINYSQQTQFQISTGEPHSSKAEITSVVRQLAPQRQKQKHIITGLVSLISTERLLWTRPGARYWKEFENEHDRILNSAWGGRRTQIALEGNSEKELIRRSVTVQNPIPDSKDEGTHSWTILQNSVKLRVAQAKSALRTSRLERTARSPGYLCECRIYGLPVI